MSRNWRAFLLGADAQGGSYCSGLQKSLESSGQCGGVYWKGPDEVDGLGHKF